MAQLVAALREQISGVADPTHALMAAIQRGEQEALRARLQVMGAQRDELQQSSEALTYQVARLDAELAARRSVDERREAAIADSLNKLHQVTGELSAAHAAPAHPQDEATLSALVEGVAQLRAALTRRRKPAAKSAAGHAKAKHSRTSLPATARRRGARAPKRAAPNRRPHSRRARAQPRRKR